MYSGPATGLYSSPNPFSAAPAGSLARADNVRYIAPFVLGPRPGNSEKNNGTFGSSNSLGDAMAFFGADLLVAYDLTKVAISVAGGAFSNFSGTFEPVGANRMHFELAARSIWFNSNTGLWVWDGTGVGGQPAPAGNPQGLNLSATNNSSNGWQSGDTAVAYRFTICSKDSFGRILEGPPSGRTTLRNLIRSTFGTSGITRSGGTTVHVTTDTPHGLSNGNVVTLTPGEADFPAGAKTVVVDNSIQFHYAEAGANVSATVTQTWNITRSADVTCYLPVDASGNPVTTSNFLRVYRSDETFAAADTPDDELFQCYESAYLTATNIANGSLTFNDPAPTDVVLPSQPLYTNPNTGDGSLAANYQPPMALDHAYFANSMWFANTRNKHSTQLALIGVGSPDGLQDGDTITFIPAGGTIADNVTFTAKTTPTTTGQFQLYGDPVFFPGDPGFNIERTARALCQAINDYPSFAAPPVYAFYVSSEGGVPGKMLFVARQFEDSDDSSPNFSNGFTLYSSRTMAWNPQLPPAVAPPFLVSSDNNRHPAGLWNSKHGQPEAVPVVNYRTVAADNNEIIRIFPLHYRLIIFKNDGIYACTNTEPFTIHKLSSYILIAPDSLDVLEERLFCLTDQGMMAIGDGGIEPVSVPIDDVLVSLAGSSSLATLKTRALGLAYRTAKQYLLWLVAHNSDGTYSSDNAQAFVYSTLSKGFTRYVFGARAACVDPNTDRMVIAPTSSRQLWLENKTLTDADFKDLATQLGFVVSSSGNRVVLPDVTGVVAGDVFSSVNGLYVIASVDTTLSSITTVGDPLTHAGAGFSVYAAIACDVRFNPLTGGSPATLKMNNQCSLLFRECGIRDTNAAFASEISQTETLVQLRNPGWGGFAWGEVPWGGPAQKLKRVEPLPLVAENCCQLTVGFSTRQAMARFEFLGVDVRQTDDSDVNHG